MIVGEQREISRRYYCSHCGRLTDQALTRAYVARQVQRPTWACLACGYRTASPAAECDRVMIAHGATLDTLPMFTGPHDPLLLSLDAKVTKPEARQGAGSDPSCRTVKNAATVKEPAIGKR